MTTPTTPPTEQDAKVDALATKLAAKLFLMLRARPTVTIDRLHRTGKTSGPACYVDLTFEGVGTVYGFKLMNKAGGQRWLAVPQTKKQGTGGAGEPEAKWEDRFKFASKAAHAEAERVVKDEFDKGAPPASEDFGGDDMGDLGGGLGGSDDIPF